MWPFKKQKRVRFGDLLTSYFGGGSDGPVVIASGGEFVQSFSWVRFTCRGLDYCVERDHVALAYGYIVQVGRADRPGRPEDISSFDRLVLDGGMPAYNEDMFYWVDIQVALGDPESSRDINHFSLERVIATLSGFETQLRALLSGDAYASLRAIQAKRIEAQEAERRQLRQPAS